MAKAGDVMTNKETGETYIFRKTASDTNGERLLIDMEVAPGGGAKAVPPHIHPVQTEIFTITEGRLWVLLDDQERICESGDFVVVPPGSVHTWSNATDSPLRFTLEIRPAGQWETLFESLCALSRQAKMAKNGRVNPFQLAVALDKYPDHMYIDGIAFGVQKAMIAVMAVFGRLMGYQSELSYFEPESGVQTIRQASPKL